MTDFEQKIREALRGETLDQPGVIEMVASNFRGRQRLSSIGGVLISLALMAVMVWCVVEFFRAADTRGMIFYATLFMFVNCAIMMLKLWFWLLMIRYSLAREVKRLELECSKLAERLDRR